MSCKDLHRNFKTSEASTKAWMRTRDLIDEFRNILDVNGFREANKKWSDHAKKEYDTSGMLFVEEQRGDNLVAIPNRDAFRKIDKYKGISYEQKGSNEDSITLDEFEKQREKIEAITGWTIEYDTSLESSAEVTGKYVKVNPDKIYQDTLVHEIAHVLIDGIGGLQNPLVRRGIQQLKGTQIEKEVREAYKDKPESIIKKEILARAIGEEGANIFNENKDNLSKWERWIDLFFKRIKQVFGIDRNVARDMANEIINHNPEMGTGAQNTYQQRDYRSKPIEDRIKELIANMKSEIDNLQKREVEDYESKVVELRKLVDHLNNAYKDVAITNYINMADERIREMKETIETEDLSISELRQLREDLAPYDNMGELQVRLEDIEWEHSDLTKDEVFDKANTAEALATYVKNKYNEKTRRKAAKKFAQRENSRIHQKKRQEYKDEFDDKHSETKWFGLGTERTLDGEKAPKGEYDRAKNQYVQKKMDQNRDAIVQEAEEYYMDAFRRSPDDLGIIEHFIYDTQIINDDIVQIITEVVDNAEYNAMTSYLEAEGILKEAYDKFKEENDIKLDQKKNWDFLLDDELDEDGNPTGDKIPFFSREYNASFREIMKKKSMEIRKAKKEAGVLFDQYKENNAKYEAEYREAVKKKNELKDEFETWKENNTKYVDGNKVPIDKWKNDRELTESQKEFKEVLDKYIDEINENYNKAGKLTEVDGLMGPVTRLPNVPKDAIEKFTGDEKFSDGLQTMKEIITPRQDDMDYESISQETVEHTRDNKLHRHVPVYYRGDIQDQSYDVPSAIMMDLFMSKNYKEKRGIEAEILALKDMAKNRNIAETKSVFGEGQQQLKNAMNPDIGLNRDSEEDISNRFKVVKGLVEAKMYGVRRQGNEKVNKMVDSLISFTSMSILPFNFFSAVSNITMGKATTLVEIFGDSVPFDIKDFGKAEKMYISNIPKILADSSKPKVTGSINKVMEKYDAMGSFHGPTFRFAKDNRGKQLFDRGLLYILQSAPEHYISGTITLAALNGMKLQNKDGEYIDTDGNVVTNRDNAANMLDYMSVVDGEIVYEDIQDAYKTDNFEAELGTHEHDKLTKNYIRDTVAQTQGQYDSKSFSLIERSMMGRMASNLRHWMFRGLDRNWRGASYAFADEIPEHAKLRNKFGGADEIGYQTQVLHTSAQSAKALWEFGKSMISEGERLKFDIVKQPWKDLKYSEISRIRKAVANWMFAATAAVAAYVIGNLDDDEEEVPDSVIYLMYALTRARQELMLYSNPLETFRILRSPAASVSMLRDGIKLIEQLLADMYSGEFERYERGRFEGETKVGKDITDIVPVYSQFNRDVRATLDYIESMSAAD